MRRLLTGLPLHGGAEERPTAGEAAAGGEAAAEAAAALVGVQGPGDPIWGVGDVRSREWYEEYSGVRFEAKQVSAQAERGGMPTEACFWNQFACLDAWLQAREAQHPEE